MSARALRNSFLAALLFIGVLLIAYLYSHRILNDMPGVSAAVTVARNRKAAPDFTLQDASGADVKLSDYRGKVVLLNFWATWCGPCRIEIPWFIEFENTYENRGFHVVGVSMDEDGWKTVKPYMEQMRMSYRVMLGDDGLTQKYGGIDSLPTTFLIDGDGKIAATHMGLVGKSTYEKEITALLSK